MKRKMRCRHLLAGFVALGLTARLVAVETRELLRDRSFTGGFAVLAAKAGDGEIGRIAFAESAPKPVWEVAQWHSRCAFTHGLAGPDNTLCVSNVARWLCLESAAGGKPTLTLGVDSRPEYDGRPRRSPAEPWVHLLLQQAITGAPPLSHTASLRLRFAVRLRAAETFRPDGYSPSLHAAQFQVVLTLNNTRRGSPGLGDYLWFVAPVYDDRYPLPPAYVAQDFAVTQGKLIYNPGGAALGLKPVRVGEWQAVDCELRPWLERALEAAWTKGYLRDSRDLADYRVAHLNLGWEVPGLNRVAMDLRGLRLEATLAEGGR